MKTLSSVLVLVLITGCGKKPAVADEKGQPATPSTTTSTPAPAPKPEPPKSGPPVVTILVETKGYFAGRYVDYDLKLKDAVVYLEDFEKEWKENELAAAKKYKGQRVLVVGCPSKIGQDGLVQLRYTDDATFNRSVLCEFSPDSGLENVKADGPYFMLEGTCESADTFRKCTVKAEQQKPPRRFKEYVAANKLVK